jgi:hypothetical protein
MPLQLLRRMQAPFRTESTGDGGMLRNGQF